MRYTPKIFSWSYCGVGQIPFRGTLLVIMAAGKKKGTTYDAGDIAVLEGLEAVRKRPGMYIGTTGLDGLYHLLWEVFDNSRDEAMGGYANEIEVVLLPENRVRVADNGRGIPVGTHPKTKISALETIMTTLHAGGKFGDGGYAVSGGLHGVGVSVVNALSEEVSAIVHRDGGVFHQEYRLGKPVEKVKEIKKTSECGTVITFYPDKKTFSTIPFDAPIFSPERVRDHLRNQAYLVRSMHVRIIDARASSSVIDPDALFVYQQLPDAPSYSFFYDSGLTSFIRHHNARQKPVHQHIFHAEKQVGDVGVEVALQYVDDISSRIFAFGNTIPNPEGGTHVTGFKTALTRTVNSYAKQKNLSKGDEAFTGDDVLEGITAIISVKLPEIQFEGQTKAKLGSVEARSAVEVVFSEAFGTFLEENPLDAKNIIAKVSLLLFRLGRPLVQQRIVFFERVRLRLVRYPVSWGIVSRRMLMSQNCSWLRVTLRVVLQNKVVIVVPRRYFLWRGKILNVEKGTD